MHLTLWEANLSNERLNLAHGRGAGAGLTGFIQSPRFGHNGVVPKRSLRYGLTPRRRADKRKENGEVRRDRGLQS